LEKGYEIAYEQFALSEQPSNALFAAGKGNGLQLSNTNNQYVISGKNFTAVFDAASGTMTRYAINGKTLLVKGPQPSFWRAPTDNDIGAGFNKSLRMWCNAYEQGKMLEAKAEQKEDGTCEVVFRKTLLNGDAETRQTFTVFDDGGVKVDASFTDIKGEYPLLMRMGTDLKAAKQYNNFQWYGRGPWENYWDRKSASLVGRYKQTVDEQYFPMPVRRKAATKPMCAGPHLPIKKAKGLKSFLQIVY